MVLQNLTKCLQNMQSREETWARCRSKIQFYLFFTLLGGLWINPANKRGQWEKSEQQNQYLLINPSAHITVDSSSTLNWAPGDPAKQIRASWWKHNRDRLPKLRSTSSSWDDAQLSSSNTRAWHKIMSLLAKTTQEICRKCLPRHVIVTCNECNAHPRTLVTETAQAESLACLRENNRKMRIIIMRSECSSFFNNHLLRIKYILKKRYRSSAFICLDA